MPALGSIDGSAAVQRPKLMRETVHQVDTSTPPVEEEPAPAPPEEGAAYEGVGSKVDLLA